MGVLWRGEELILVGVGLGLVSGGANLNEEAKIIKDNLSAFKYYRSWHWIWRI